LDRSLMETMSIPLKLMVLASEYPSGIFDSFVEA
jgi:hypothetical protein